MAIQNKYNDWSETYDSDRNLTRDLDGIVTEKTLSAECFRAVIELGCGTGKNTQFLAGICEKLIAIDFSDGMLSQAREKIKADNVTFLAADITKSWNIADNSADMIISNLVLEHIEDVSFIFSEAGRVLIDGGIYFLSELHPYRQYQGKKAEFNRGGEITEIPAFVHHISDFVTAAENNNFALKTFKEWWHKEDINKPPRLISFIFQK